MVPLTQNARPSLPPPPAAAVDTSVEDNGKSAPPLLVRDQLTGQTRAIHTPLSAAFRFVEPTWRNYIMYVDLEARTGNLDARRYLDCWLSLSPRERATHLPEQLCDMTNVQASDLIRWVSGQAWQEGAAKSAMCMSFMRDRVLEKTAEFAMADAGNYKHAELFMRASGALPPSGSGRAAPTNVNLFNMPVSSSGSVAGVRGETGPVVASGLRDMDAEVVELSKIMQGEGPALQSAAERRPDDIEEADEDEGAEDEDDEDNR